MNRLAPRRGLPLLARPLLATPLLAGLFVAVLVVAGVALVPGASAQDLSEIEIKIQHVAGKVHMLEGRGGNIGLSVGEDGILMVDSQFEPLAAKIRAAIAERFGGEGSAGEGPLEVRYLLNTHWHGDHTGGNAEFGAPGDGASVMAHDNVRRRMTRKNQIRGRDIEPAAPGKLPVVTFNDQLSVHWNGEEIRAMHFSHAHTDGDSVVWFAGSNVVHMGDMMWTGRFPFVDMDNGGDVLGLIDGIQQVLARLPADVKLIPGHGPLSDRSGLEDFRDMLVATTDIVRARMAAGETVEQIVEQGLPEQRAEWGSGFIKTDVWLRTIHRSLSGQGEPFWHPHGH